MGIGFEEYRPDQFSKICDTPLGRRLWDFLTSTEVLHAMDVASDLGQPAVAGIEEALLTEFGAEILPDRIKQMIGHMIRQAMESEGFVVDQSDVKMNSAPFAKATRYRRPDWFTLHAFRNTANPRDLCFKCTRSTDGLPSDASWRYWSTFSTTLRGTVVYGIDVRNVREEVRRNGFARRPLKRLLDSTETTAP